MTQAWGQLTGYRIIGIDEYPVEPFLPEQLRPEYLRHAGVLPIALANDELTIALADGLQLPRQS